MQKKLLESAFLIFFLTLCFFSWLNKARWMELVSLLGIVGVGYAFKSSPRWKLTIGGFVLAISLPLVTLTLGKTWYWVTVFMILPPYYLGSLIRLSRTPLKSLIVSVLMFIPFVIPLHLNFYIWGATALYWLVLGLVGGRIHSSYLEVLVPPLVVYTLSLVMVVTLTLTETQLLKVASLTPLLPIYPVGAAITMALKGK
ncbi:hypothetical protein APY94_02700 [Thermococcus celericrescens]|uniref:Uncharacterized protein n=1 Tax=Thermococcus celericrescens TaxID=227598 RepID=A0A124EBI7_9EURY|nr:hypothetical protein [Thermococcus celericrescens]KUH34204.1 hypothetical protein APY94_02700 [Thermococcus celericrescens]